MAIYLLMHELEVCPVLDTGARRSVLPLHHYNAIHSDVRPSLQPSLVKTLLGVGPGDIPVLSEAYVLVQINSRQVIADIAGDEVLLGHPFLVQAQARLDFGNHRIVLFGEEVPYFQSHSKPRALAVKVARTVLLGTGEEYVVPGNTRCRRQINGEVLLNPTKRFVEKHKVLLARAVVEARPLKVVSLCIFNPGNRSVTIKKGAIAGVLQPVKVLPSAATAQGEQIVGHTSASIS